MKKAYVIAIGLFLATLIVIAIIVTKTEHKKQAETKTEEITETEILVENTGKSKDGTEIQSGSSDDSSEETISESGDEEDLIVRTGDPEMEAGATERVTYSEDGNTIYINDVGGELYNYSENSIYPDLVNYSCKISNASIIEDNELPIERFVADFYIFCINRKYELPEDIVFEERKTMEGAGTYVKYYFSFKTANVQIDETPVDTTPFTAKAMMIFDNNKFEIYDLTDDQ